jgi:hypothetical protein
MLHDLNLSLAEKRWVCTRTYGSWAGAAMAPEERITLKVRRVWVVNGASCAWRAKLANYICFAPACLCYIIYNDIFISILCCSLFAMKPTEKTLLESTRLLRFRCTERRPLAETTSRLRMRMERTLHATLDQEVDGATAPGRQCPPLGCRVRLLAVSPVLTGMG